jgi:hypothetical protein
MHTGRVADVICGSEGVSRNAGPALILRDPVNPTIPYGLIPKASRNYPCARADSRANSHDDSELFIVDVWALNKSRPPNPGHHEVGMNPLQACPRGFATSSVSCMAHLPTEQG